jgi:hypothetical protein
MNFIGTETVSVVRAKSDGVDIRRIGKQKSRVPLCVQLQVGECW